MLAYTGRIKDWKFNQKLVPKGLRILPLRYSEKKALIYVYSPKRLEADLKDKIALDLLKSCGYTYKSPTQCVAHLAAKLRQQNIFPHEIGLFLGYPPEDVLGFIEKKERKYTGYWKVYSDERKARNIFERYKRCYTVYYSQWSRGKTVEELTRNMA